MPGRDWSGWLNRYGRFTGIRFGFWSFAWPGHRQHPRLLQKPRRSLQCFCFYAPRYHYGSARPVWRWPLRTRCPTRQLNARAGAHPATLNDVTHGAIFRQRSVPKTRPLPDAAARILIETSGGAEFFLRHRDHYWHLPIEPTLTRHMFHPITLTGTSGQAQAKSSSARSARSACRVNHWTGDLYDCQEVGPYRCPYALSYGNAYFCRHPDRAEMATRARLAA